MTVNETIIPPQGDQPVQEPAAHAAAPWETVQRVAAAVCALLIVALVGAAVLDLGRDAAPSTNGDVVGPDRGETVMEYQQRAAATLQRAPGGERAFALVTFASPLDPQQAQEMVAGIRRVNAIVPGYGGVVPVPEPTVLTPSRAEVFDLYLKADNRALESVLSDTAGRPGVGALAPGVGLADGAGVVSAVVVWDDGDALRQVASKEQVLAVEALPPDAVWGAFGVRLPVSAPVSVPGS